MSYEISNYGNGGLGDVTTVTTTINSYARVTGISSTTITINSTTQMDGDATFSAGAKVLIHVSASTSTSYRTYLGRYLVATITNATSTALTIDKDFTQILPASELNRYYVQVIAIPQYRNLTLSSGTIITPPVFSASTFVGGIVALMCSETLTFAGGHISLADRGIPVASKALRPVTNYDVQQDTATYAGWENSATKDYFMLNAGDGAAFIVAKNINCNSASRIGNISTYGVQFYRGSSTSVTYNENAPSNVTNVGGSTILIAAQSIANFTPRMIAKYRTASSAAGQGICRCYIASETKLRNDEGLYAYDCLNSASRFRNFNIKNFGNGSVGDVTNPTVQLNNYASITAISGRKLTYKGQTTAGLSQIGAGSLVMIHYIQKTSTFNDGVGRFILANVLSDNGTVLTIDADLPFDLSSALGAQVISIPQFNSFRLSTTNSATPKFDGTKGGICAIAVKGVCNLSGGIIDVTNKGGGNAYGRNGLAIIGNSQNSDKLPIGQGHGSVFILAQNLTMNTSTRIGNTSNGALVHGYRTPVYGNYGGSGASGGTGTYNGGYGSNGIVGSYYTNWFTHCQGAHIMIVADKITGFNQNAISTGGGYAGYCPAGAGYSAGNPWLGNYCAYNGGTATGHYYYSSSGSAGWAFIYCNESVSQNTAGTILAL